jgi:hypothetical protein
MSAVIGCEKFQVKMAADRQNFGVFHRARENPSHHSNDFLIIVKVSISLFASSLGRAVTKQDLLSPPIFPANPSAPVSPAALPRSPALHPVSVQSSIPPINTPSFHIPILLAVLPPLGSLFVGTTDSWSDALILLFTGFYLYNLVKIPWELYDAIRARIPPTMNTKDKDQMQAYHALKRQERLLFVLVLVSPFLGGLLLLVLQKTMLTNSNKYLTPNTIMLYVLAASMRPLSHLIVRIQSTGDRLQTAIMYPQDNVKMLLGRLREMEMRVEQMRDLVVDKKEMEQAKEELETGLESVARAVRQFAKHAEKERKVLDVQVERTEERVRSVEEWVETQRVHAAQSSLIVRAVWEPVTVLKEAVGYSRVPLLGYSGKSSSD